jgi:hypothetical protein
MPLLWRPNTSMTKNIFISLSHLLSNWATFKSWSKGGYKERVKEDEYIIGNIMYLYMKMESETC